MRINTNTRKAFTILEVMVAMMVCGVVIFSLYAGLSQGFKITQISRENLRATQVMVERLESIRLNTFDQLNTPGFVPTQAIPEPYYSVNSNDNGGFNYSVTVILTNAPLTTSYTADLKMVTVKISWTSGNIFRQREMSTLIARNGLQSYIY
ncbi:MAG: prepilin-type N-terminal cleavage/methylation domain-containing protein [Verrucomicrobiota bacterium]